MDPYKLRARLEWLQTRSTARAERARQERSEFVMPPVTFERTRVAAAGGQTQKPTKYVPS